MGMFTKKQTVKEQIELDSLLPDKEKVTKLKKQLTAVETSRNKFEDRLHELKREADKHEKTQDFTTKGHGIEGGLASIQRFMTSKKQLRSLEEIAEESYLMAKLWNEFATEKLQEIYTELSPLITIQASRIADVEEYFETAHNSNELDEVYSLLSEDLNELKAKFQGIAEIPNTITGKKTFERKLPVMERNSLADKHKQAQRDAQSGYTHLSRLQEATDAQAIAEGREVSQNPTLQALRN